MSLAKLILIISLYFLAWIVVLSVHIMSSERLWLLTLLMHLIGAAIVLISWKYGRYDKLIRIALCAIVVVSIILVARSLSFVVSLFLIPVIGLIPDSAGQVAPTKSY